jgi:hypothetical protein
LRPNPRSTFSASGTCRRIQSGSRRDGPQYGHHLALPGVDGALLLSRHGARRGGVVANAASRHDQVWFRSVHSDVGGGNRVAA